MKRLDQLFGHDMRNGPRLEKHQRSFMIAMDYKDDCDLCGKPASVCFNLYGLLGYAFYFDFCKKCGLKIAQQLESRILDLRRKENKGVSAERQLISRLQRFR